MRRIIGSALIDYLIPTAIVGVVLGLGLYGLHESGVLKKFIAASLNIDISDEGKGVMGENVAKTTTSVIPATSLPTGTDIDKLVAGDLKGTPEKPVKMCNGNDCVLDFGSAILKHIPEDFGAYVQTNGTSGGTEKLSALLLQLADQVDDDKTGVDEGADLRNLANLGHFTASAIYEGEEIIKTKCTSGNSNCLDSINLDYIAKKLTLPANLSGVLTDYPASKYSVADLVIPNAIGISGTKQLGSLRETKIKYPTDTLYNMHTTDHPIYAMIETYDKVQANTDPRYTDTVKAITEQLFLDLDRVIYDFQERNHMYSGGAAEYKHQDPITGLETGEPYIYTKPSGIDDDVLAESILAPKASIFTDIDSALICTTGTHDDTGKACK